MGHCNPQMSDFSPQTPPGVTGGVYVKSNDSSNYGVSVGDGCVSNGARVACSYRQSWNAIVVYDGDGNILWGSAGLLDSHTFSGLPIIQADGSVVAGDDQHLYGFNPDGSVAWSTVTPGGTPIGLVPTPNGAIVTATASQQLSQCWQGNCALAFNITNGGTNYTTATVILAGGYCPGASATATITNGVITGIAASGALSCFVAPDVLIMGDGTGASALAVLNAPSPVTVYSGFTGAVVGSSYLYQSGSSGPYYATSNTPCINNGSYPNRLYMLAVLGSDQTQGALLALDIDPTNLSSPLTPAWSLPFHGPANASPLCVGNHVYFDGSGIVPGDNVGTTIFGIQDNGTSGAWLFQVPLGPNSQIVTCNFALDPRAEGGFWHQIRYDPNIYHRDFLTGAIIETVNVTNLLLNAGAPVSTYWQAGVFTTYGSTTQPYLMLPEAATPGGLGYLVMLDVAALRMAWAVPLAGNDANTNDTPGGDVALVMDSHGNPVLAMSGKETGAYFITGGGPDAALTPLSLTFGTQNVGSTSAAQTVTLFNNASAVLNISSITASAPFNSTNTCGNSLAPGVSCTIKVTFRPGSAGSKTGVLTVASNSQASPQTVALSGVGSAATAMALLSATQVTFPAQAYNTLSAAQTVTLSNTGTATLSISSIVAAGAAAETDNCPLALTPGANCAINLMLAAPAAGACSGTVTVNSNASNNPQVISATGSCVATPATESALSTSSLVFPPQATGTVSTPRTVTLRNVGTQVLSISGIVAAGDVSQTNTCGATLAVAAQCTLNVSFAPSATGLRSGSVTVTDAAPDSPHVIAISGVGSPNPVPLVHQPLLPGVVLPGTAGLTLTLNGAGFVPGSVVYWNSTPRLTTFISSSRISATITAADLASPATGSVSVVNPPPGGGQSNIVGMPVAYPVPAPLFTTTTQSVSAGPSALAAADFDLNGKLDLAVANANANTVSILLGNGDGTFTPIPDYPAGNHPVAVVTGDLNHDGIPDLVVVNQADNTVSILLGQSGGAFGPQATFATGAGPAGVALADVNADGNLDVIVANFSANTVSILAGNGDGTFATHVDYTAGVNPSAVVAGDFDLDGKIDLAVANDVYPGGAVTVLLNHGDGSFLPGVGYSSGDAVSLVAIDLNNDGKLDLAAVNQMLDTLNIHIGNGNGKFKAGPTQQSRMSPDPVALAVAGMTGDGMLDVVVAANSSNGLIILVNNNAAAFSPLAQYGTAAGVGAMALGDFNNDGSPDVILAEPASNTISVMLQAPAVSLSSPALSFGNVQVGAPATQTFMVVNSGSAMLTINSVTAAGVAFSQTNNCVGSIAPGISCTVTVTFTPSAAGNRTGTVTIRDNAPGGPQTISLSGTGATFTVSVALLQSSAVGGVHPPETL